MDYEYYDLWENTPGTASIKPHIRFYKAKKPVTDSTIIIIPGSGYAADPSKPVQEGERVAKYFQGIGISCFVAVYRIAPDYFPLPVLDGRRAVRFVRYNADKFGINKNKVAVLGYSAGGHLTASLSAYKEKLDFEGLDEIDAESCIPDIQVLCYPVINISDNTYAHIDSGTSLLNDKYDEMKDILSHDYHAAADTPPTFIWHTFADTCVSVVNTLEYAKRLKMVNVPCEVHIFPDGDHGMGLPVEDAPLCRHISQWLPLLINYLKYKEFIYGNIQGE